jgi:hypothetical protein
VTSAARLALLGVAWHGEYLRPVATARGQHASSIGDHTDQRKTKKVAMELCTMVRSTGGAASASGTVPAQARSKVAVELLRQPERNEEA